MVAEPGSTASRFTWHRVPPPPHPHPCPQPQGKEALGVSPAPLVQFNSLTNLGKGLSSHKTRPACVSSSTVLCCCRLFVTSEGRRGLPVPTWAPPSPLRFLLLGAFSASYEVTGAFKTPPDSYSSSPACAWPWRLLAVSPGHCSHRHLLLPPAAPLCWKP